MIKITKVISTAFDSLDRLKVKILRLGKSDVQDVLEISPYGIDSNPIKDMVAIYTETSEKGKSVVIGYINKDRLAAPGETRLFSTDADGVLKFYTWLKADGTLELGGSAKHLARFEELKTGFDQLKTNFNSFVSAFNSHVHATAAVGAPSPPTPVPTVIPVTPSSASIDSSKIDEIKTL